MKIDETIAMISHIKEYIVDNQGDKEYGGALDMAIEALEKQKTFDNGTWVDKDYHDKVYALLQERYFKALERTRWIPVSERLPTEYDAKNNRGGFVLIHRSKSVWDVDFARWYNVTNDDLTTHWMPLPSIPSEDKI